VRWNKKKAMKAPEDILFEVSDYGFTNGVELLNDFQKHLFYFNEFVIYTNMGGGGGFIYNRSPDENGNTEHEVYINSFRFFGFNDIANDLEKYFIDYQKLIKKWIQYSKPNFESMLKHTNLEDTYEVLSGKLEKLSKEHDYVYQWINENYNKVKLA
jgi:hypothetical protein